MDVPKPGVGYWEKLKAKSAHNIITPPLPELKSNTPTQIEFKSSPKKVIDITDIPEIKVTNDLSFENELVKETYKILKSGKWNWDLKNSSFEGSLDLKVSKSCINRALNIFEAVIRVMEKRGHKILIEKDYRDRSVTCFVNNEEKVFVTLVEFTSFKGKLDKFGGKVFEPTSKLILMNNNWFDDVTYPKTLTDGKTQKIESRLGLWVLGLKVAAKHEKIKRLDREELSRKLLEIERIHKEDKAKVKRLDKMMGIWKSTKEIQDFITDMRESGFSDVYFLSMAECLY